MRLDRILTRNGSRPESSDREFKACSSGRLSDRVKEVISAFANTEGGLLGLGLDNHGLEIGLPNHEVDKLQADLVSLCKTGFNIEIRPDIQVAGRHIEAYIPPSPAQLRPVFIDGRGVDDGTYVRVGSVNQAATIEDIKRFSVAAQGGAETVVYADHHYADCLDLELFDDFIAHVNQTRNNVYSEFNQEELLIKQGAADRAGNVTCFGLLAFADGRRLQEVIAPTISLTMIHYAGLDKVNPDNPHETHIDDKIFDGSVVSQFEQAFAYIQTRLPTRGLIDSATGRRQNILAIPRDAIREAIANSLVHRDYSVRASSIQVDIYQNRVEITNPGPSLIPIDQLETSPSVSRNPLLMVYLRELNITERRATGIRKIKNLVREAGLKQPEFANLYSSFRVVLYRSPLLSQEDRVWLDNLGLANLNQRQTSALVYLRGNNSAGISNSDYRRINSMNNVGDDRRARQELARLAETGILIASGGRRHRYYFLRE